ncbi:MAG TPA: ATP-binding protein [Lacisediminihabitans sp.]|uniref:sensor histidine kinase n=1 Tax=Lacisediminihabitans sp. TaxID=2787631 RepID=UPI002ED93D6F
MTTFLDTVARRLSVDEPSPRLKQTPTTVAFVVAVGLALFVPHLTTIEPISVIVSCAAMAVATLLSFLFSRSGHPGPWALVVPGLSLIAIALLRSGTGGSDSLFTALIFLPIIWIAAEKGRRWILVTMVGTSLTILLPYLITPGLSVSVADWLRGVFAPLIIGLASAMINELARQARRQFDSIENLAREREEMLVESLSFADRLQQNEARLHAADRLTRSVLDAVTEQSVIGTDLTGLVDVWNPGASMMLGLAADETQGKRYIFEFHLEEELENRSRELNYPPGETVLNPGFSALVESARLGQAEVRTWTYVRYDGSTLSVSVAVTPRVDDDGVTVGYIFVGTDVTQALEVARLKDEFVGLISHELRTPLSSILGYLELMRDDETSPLSDEQLQYLGVAERNAHRLLRLVGDLLFTAQVSSGTFPLDVGQVTLNDVVASAVESARPAAAAAGVEMTLTLPEEAVSLRGDSLRLGQACDNLISNAIKFTPRGGLVTVSLTTTTSEAIITVRDTGMGIPASELDQLYARFFRASTATRNAVPGVGLGLTITKAIVTSHEGKLDVESEEGVGTAFILTLPLPRHS